MTYISLCKHCLEDLDRHEEVVSGVRCDGCSEFIKGYYHHNMPPGWISFDFGEDNGEDGEKQVEKGEPEYIEQRNYCPICSVTIRHRLWDYPLPYSRADPSRPEETAS